MNRRKILTGSLVVAGASVLPIVPSIAEESTLNFNWAFLRIGEIFRGAIFELYDEKTEAYLKYHMSKLKLDFYEKHGRLLGYEKIFKPEENKFILDVFMEEPKYSTFRTKWRFVVSPTDFSFEDLNKGFG